MLYSPQETNIYVSLTSGRVERRMHVLINYFGADPTVLAQFLYSKNFYAWSGQRALLIANWDTACWKPHGTVFWSNRDNHWHLTLRGSSYYKCSIIILKA